MRPLFYTMPLVLLLCAGTAVAHPQDDSRTAVPQADDDPTHGVAPGGEVQTAGDVGIGLLADDFDKRSVDWDAFRFDPVVAGPWGEAFACLFLILTGLLSVAYILKADARPPRP